MAITQGMVENEQIAPFEPRLHSGALHSGALRLKTYALKTCALKAVARPVETEMWDWCAFRPKEKADWEVWTGPLTSPSTPISKLPLLRHGRGANARRLGWLHGGWAQLR